MDFPQGDKSLRRLNLLSFIPSKCLVNTSSKKKKIDKVVKSEGSRSRKVAKADTMGYYILTLTEAQEKKATFCRKKKYQCSSPTGASLSQRLWMKSYNSALTLTL